MKPSGNNLLYSKIAQKKLETLSQESPDVLPKIKSTFESIQANPFLIFQESEPLRFELSGYYSQKIDPSHSAIFKILGDKILVITILSF